MGRRGKELDPFVRTRLCELKAYGLSYRKIHELYRHIPLSTIKTTVLMEKKRVNNASLPRPGHPRKLTAEHRDHLYELSKSDPHIKLDDMLSEVDHVVKKRSIQRLLKEMGRRKRFH